MKYTTLLLYVSATVTMYANYCPNIKVQYNEQTSEIMAYVEKDATMTTYYPLTNFQFDTNVTCITYIAKNTDTQEIRSGAEMHSPFDIIKYIPDIGISLCANLLNAIEQWKEMMHYKTGE